VLETTPENVLEQVNGHILPAILTVNEVLPDMIKNRSGAILFTTGLSVLLGIQIILQKLGITYTKRRIALKKLSRKELIQLNCQTNDKVILMVKALRPVLGRRARLFILMPANHRNLRLNSPPFAYVHVLLGIVIIQIG